MVPFAAISEKAGCAMKRATFFACLCLVLLFSLTAAAQEEENLDVFVQWRKYANAENALYHAIADEALTYLDARDRRLASFRTGEEWTGYRAVVREKLRTAFGPLPERTPLDARVTGSFEHEGISVENILFESRPGFLVTTSFFKPADSTGRLPVVVYVCGHTSDGYKSPTYQHVILNMARKGIAVLAVDPVGQGERWLYFDPGTGESSIGGPTSEHSYAGVQYLPLGRTMAMVRLWDCIRALDYLETRDDVDMNRVGVHGRSGGGTMSAQLGAMDDRIAAAAPECYITSFRRLFESIGPQDAEQNLLGQIALGLDHGDFLVARAPRPTLVAATTRDFFSIQGVRETVRSVTPAFTAMRYGDDQRLSRGNIRLIEDDAPHQSTELNRERVYGFFMDAFGLTGPTDDEDIPPIDPALLQVTETGQVLTSGSRSIHDIIMDDARPVLAALQSARNRGKTHLEKVGSDFPGIAGMRMTAMKPDAVFTGRYQREGCSVGKYVLQCDDGIPLPALLFIPDGAENAPGLVYVSDAGKKADALPGGLIERIAGEGVAVLAIDPPGIGELGPNTSGDDSVINGVSYNLIFGAQLIGRSVTGIQAGAVLSAVHFLKGLNGIDADNIAVAARGITGPAVLHAAAADPTITGLGLVESPLSWESMVKEPQYAASIGSTVVPSALLVYDLPDLLALTRAKTILLADPVVGDGSPAGAGAVKNITELHAALSDRPGSGLRTLRNAPETTLVRELAGLLHSR